MPQAPWEKYQTQPAGPWNKYAAPEVNPNAVALARQKAQFPTSAEQGGKSGAAILSGNSNAAILAQQAAQFPTSTEQGGTPGAAIEPGFTASNLGRGVMNPAPGGSSGVPKAVTDFVGAAAPSAAEWQGLSRLPSMLASSPAAELVKGAANLAKRGLQKVGALNADVPLAQQIEQKIAPSGKRAQALTADVSAKLAEHPALVNAKAGQPFDRALASHYAQAGQAQRAVEATIPDMLPVPKRDIQDAFADLIERYRILGADDAVKALKLQVERIDRIPGDSIPWGEFSGNKTRFGNDLKKAGVWNRLMGDAATEKDHALAQAYGSFMEASNGISEALTQANQKFSTAHDAMVAAGLNLDQKTPNFGRRMAQVGKAPAPSVLKTLTVKGLKMAGGGAASTIGGGALYKIYKAIEP